MVVKPVVNLEAYGLKLTAIGMDGVPVSDPCPVVSNEESWNISTLIHPAKDIGFLLDLEQVQSF